MSTPLPPLSATGAAGIGVLYDHTAAASSSSSSTTTATTAATATTLAASSNNTSSNNNIGSNHRRCCSLRAAPIAHFSSTPNDGIGNDKVSSSKHGNILLLRGGLPTAGRLLAANSAYVAYAVKKGLVRVIHRHSGAKTLLRGHAEHVSVVDAAFFGVTDDGEGAMAGAPGILWRELAALHRIRKRRHSAAQPTDEAGKKNAVVLPSNPRPRIAPNASNLLATVGGMGDEAGVILWAIGKDDDATAMQSQGQSSSDRLEFQRLATIRTNFAARVVWNPIRPEFALLHRNYTAEDDDVDSAMGTTAKGRQVATLVDPTILLRADPGDDAAHGRGVVTHSLLVDFDGEGRSSGLEGANDIAWSGTGRNFLLTGHDDGCVRLWDVAAARKNTHGEAKDESTIDGIIHSVTKWNVVSTSRTGRDNEDGKNGTTRFAGAVTRVLFLDRYEDSIHCETTARAVTPPFVTGTDMNHTVTLWSSFTCGSDPSIIGSPTRLRVFGLRSHVDDDSFPLSDMITLELCPAPYRPPLSLKDSSTRGIDEETLTPSSFLLMAERNVGLLHALHLETEWKASSDGNDVAAAVAVKGFDYVTTLNVVHPIYSFCVAPTAPTTSSDFDGGGKTNALRDDHDVDLCCIQSKAVQMLTLAAEMCAAPEINCEGLDLAPGVTLLNFDVDDEDGEEVAEEVGEEYDEGDFEEDYEMEEEDLANAEFSTNHSEDEDEIDGVLREGVRPDAVASNWLGAIVNPAPSSTPARTSGAPPGLSLPPGLGLPSVTSPMSFLSPMQILSESSSDVQDSNQKIMKFPPSVVAAVVASPTSKPVTKVKKQKGPDGKTRGEVKQSVTPTKILHRDEPRDEQAAGPIQPAAVQSVAFTEAPAKSISTVDLSDIDDIIQRSIATQLKSLETELLSSLKKVIPTEVRNAVSFSFKEAEKSTEKVVQHGIASGLSAGLKKSLDGELGKSLDAHVKESVALVTKVALESMQPMIMNSFHQTMRDAMIPAYEAATRQMFDQTSTSLEEGLLHLSANQTSAITPTIQTMSTEMKKLNEVVTLLAAEVVKLRGELNASSVKQNDIPRHIDLSPQPQDIRDEIKALCQSNRYEEAFTKAVSVSDGEIVLFACMAANSAAVFNGEVALSQPILLCLMQQLGAVLVAATETDDIKTILNWLQEIAVTIDPTNFNIQRHVQQVIEQLLANINGKMSNCNPAFRRPLQTLMQVIRGLL